MRRGYNGSGSRQMFKLLLMLATLGTLMISAGAGLALAGNTNGTILQPSVGVNTMNLFTLYLGDPCPYSGKLDCQRVTREIARETMKDAANMGAEFVRVAVPGFGKNEILHWRENPLEHWTLMEQMLDELEANGLKMIPVFIWWEKAYPFAFGGTTRDMLTNPNAQSYKKAAEYIADFISRFRDRKGIYFYELTHELNLQADITDFSTDEMTAYLGRLANQIRSLDSSRPISSGFGCPRPDAYKRWKGLRGTQDSEWESKQWLQHTHQNLDIMSCHPYTGDNKRFGRTGDYDMYFLDVFKQAADEVGKSLYLGGLGDTQSYIFQDPGTSFTRAVLDKAASLGISVVLRDWEFYNVGTFNPDAWFDIERGVNSEIVKKLNQASVAPGTAPVTPQNPDTTPPSVLIAWPVPHSEIGYPTQRVYALASDNNGTISRVEFYVDGTLLYTAFQYPYQWILDTMPLGEGLHTLVARAYDASNNFKDSEPVTVNLQSKREAGMILAQRDSASTIGITWNARELDSSRRVELWVYPNGRNEEKQRIAYADGGENQIHQGDRSIQISSGWDYYDFKLYSVSRYDDRDQKVLDHTIVPILSSFHSPSGTPSSSSGMASGRAGVTYSYSAVAGDFGGNDSAGSSSSGTAATQSQSPQALGATKKKEVTALGATKETMNAQAASAGQSDSSLPPAVNRGNTTGTGSQYYTTNVSGMDSVNLVNGRTEIHIPLATLKGRNGMDVSLTASYSSNHLWETEPEEESLARIHQTENNERYPVLRRFPDERMHGGWRVSLSTDWILVQYAYRTTVSWTNGYVEENDTSRENFVRYVVYSPDGSSHELRNNRGTEKSVPIPNNVNATSRDWSIPRLYGSIDNTGMELDHSNWEYPVLKLKDGTSIRFHFYGGENDEWSKSPFRVYASGFGEVQAIVDTNNNTVSAGAWTRIMNNGVLTGFEQHITDTLGRDIVKQYPVSGSYSNLRPKTVTFPGNKTYTFEASSYECIPSRVELLIDSHPGAAHPEVTGFFHGITKITLPNQQSYRFEYRDFTKSGDRSPVSDGLVSRIIYPSGAETKYEYGVSANPWWADNVHRASVLSRTVYPNGQSSPGNKWTYSSATMGGGVRVCDPLTTCSVHNFSTGGIEIEVTTPLKTIRRELEGELGTAMGGDEYNVRVKRETVTVDGVTTAREFTYDRDGFSWQVNGKNYVHTLGNVVKVTEFGFGGGTPIRTTKNAYWYQSHTDHQQAHILDRVAQTEIYEGDGSNSAQRKAFTAYEYNAKGNRTSVTQYSNAAAGSGAVTTTHGYDQFGNVTQTTDANKRTTLFDYTDNFDVGNKNTFAYLTNITNALGHKTSMKYEFNTGLLSSQTDANNQTTTYVYNDSLSRLKQKSGPASSPVTFNYVDTPGQVSVTETQGAFQKVTRFDGLGRVSQVEENSSGQTAAVKTTYDALGRVQTVSHPGFGAPGLATTFEYDVLDRRTRVIQPDNNTVTTDYTGVTETITDEVVNTTIRSRDALGRIVEVREQAGGIYTTDYQYDVLNNLTQVTQGAQTRRFFYDGLSRLRAYILPEIPVTGASPYSSVTGMQVSVSLDYDGVGNLISKSQAQGPLTAAKLATITYTHDDLLNRLTTVSYSGGAVTTAGESYGYDTAAAGKGRLAWKTNSAARTEIQEYDGEGRPKSVRQTLHGVSATMKYVYDPLGNLTQMTYPSGRVVTMQIPVKRVKSVTADKTLASGVGFGPHGAMTDASYGNSMVISRTYDPARLQPQTDTVAGAGTTALNLTYVFKDTAGKNNGSLRALSSGKDGSSYTFSYNGRDELISATKSKGNAPWSQAFGIDQYGNLSITGSGNGAGLIFNPSTNQISSAGYEYDAAGNLIRDPQAQYQYDAAGRLVQVSGSSLVKYHYDVDGRRIAKERAGSIMTLHFLDSFTGRVLSEYEGTPAQVEAPAAGKVGKITYLHADYLGSVRAATDDKGQPLYGTDYLPYGEEIGRTGSPPDRRYTGKHREEVLRIDYSEARWYGYEKGRFLSVDPLLESGKAEHPTSWNRYTYGANNPYKYVDPDGRIIQEAWNIFNLGVGGASLVYDLKKGNYGWAAIDAVGLVIDAAATASVVVPGGASSLIKAARGAHVAQEALHAAQLASKAAKAEEGTLVLYKMQKGLANFPVQAGDYVLHLPNKGSVLGNLNQNFERLWEVMKKGNPIRDSFVDANGKLKDPGAFSFLNNERNWLRQHKWMWDKASGFWLPPTH